jgi:hypothetical protein
MQKAIITSAALIGTGLLLAGFFPGYYYYHTQMDNRTVTVKGLAEQDVVADLAIWTIRFQTAGNDILLAKKDIENQQKMIADFLVKAGFAADEIGVQGLTMQDAYADSYRDKSSISARYTLNQTMLVRTDKVALVKDTYPNIGDLVSKGVTFNPYGNGVSYVYTKLNEIKPQMLNAAIVNAKAAADEFAKTSGSKVGDIRHANQGVFSITAREENPDSSESGQINKKVRVVSTIEYFLK